MQTGNFGEIFVAELVWKNIRRNVNQNVTINLNSLFIPSSQEYKTMESIVIIPLFYVAR